MAPASVTLPLTWPTSCFPLRSNWLAAELAPRSKRPRWAKMAGNNLRKVRKAAVLGFFWDFVGKLKTRTREGDQAGFYKHLKTMNLEGKRDRSSAYIKDEDVVLLKDVGPIRKRWVCWLQTLLNANSSKLDPNIAEGLNQWSENMPLGIQPTMQELTCATRLLPNRKVVGPDGVFVELFKTTLNSDPALHRRLLDIVICIWRGARCCSSGICNHHSTP